MADVAVNRGDLETADTEARRVVDLTEEFRQAASVGVPCAGFWRARAGLRTRD